MPFASGDIRSLPSQLSLGNELSFELAVREKCFLGFGAISCGNVTLRNRRRPMFVEIRNPFAVELLNYRVTYREDSPERILFAFRWMRARAGDGVDGHEVRPRYSTADWTRAPKPAESTTLELNCPRAANDRQARLLGFSYRYNYRSPTIPLYKILDRGSWEIGGSALGNEFWMRNCFVPSISESNRRRNFTRRNGIFRIAQTPAPFNSSLCKRVPGVFLHGVTCRPPRDLGSEVAHIGRSLKSRAGRSDDAFSRACGDLEHEFSTSPMEVLWSPGGRNRVDLANDYEAVRELVHETLHAQIGMRRERVTTFGQIEDGLRQTSNVIEAGSAKASGSGRKNDLPGKSFREQHEHGAWQFCATVDHKVRAQSARISFALFATMPELEVQPCKCGATRRSRA